MPSRQDIERSATVLIRTHGSHEAASAWAEGCAQELLAAPDLEDVKVMLWIARAVRSRIERSSDTEARRRCPGDI